MTMFYQEDSYVTIDCLECNFNLVLLHNHDSDQASQRNTHSHVLDED